MTATLGLSAKTQTWRTKHVESKKPQLEEGFPEYNNRNGTLKAHGSREWNLLRNQKTTTKIQKSHEIATKMGSKGP